MHESEQGQDTEHHNVISSRRTAACIQFTYKDVKNNESYYDRSDRLKYF